MVGTGRVCKQKIRKIRKNIKGEIPVPIPYKYAKAIKTVKIWGGDKLVMDITIRKKYNIHFVQPFDAVGERFRRPLKAV